MDNPTHGPRSPDAAVVKFDDPKDVLIAARKLIEKPENWTRRYYAHSADGEQLEPNDPRASMWCMIGACCRVQNIEPTEASEAEKVLSKVIDASITDFNDNPETTHAEVLAAFDRAIEQCAVGDRESQPTSTEVA